MAFIIRCDWCEKDISSTNRGKETGLVPFTLVHRQHKYEMGTIGSGYSVVRTLQFCTADHIYEWLKQEGEITD